MYDMITMIVTCGYSNACQTLKEQWYYYYRTGRESVLDLVLTAAA